MLLRSFGTLLLAALLLHAEDVDPALRSLEAQLTSDANDLATRYQLVDRYLAQLRTTGRLEWLAKARRTLDAAPPATPLASYPAARLAAARVALAERRYAQAVELVTEYCTAHPSNPSGVETLFDAQWELGHYEAAEKTLAQLEFTGASSASVRSRQARLAAVLETNPASLWAEAVTAARRHHDPEALSWCLLQQGISAFMRGDLALAEKCYDEARALTPRDYQVLSRLAELQAAQEKFEAALDLLKEVIQATDRPEYLQAAGDLEMARHQPAAAQPWYDRALAGYRASMDRGEILHRHHLASFYCDARPRPAEAVRLAREEVAGHASIHALALLAWALHLNGQLEEAAATAERALVTGTQDAHILYQAALIYTAAGNITRGRELLRSAETANPRRAAFHLHP